MAILKNTNGNIVTDYSFFILMFPHFGEILHTHTQIQIKNEVCEWVKKKFSFMCSVVKVKISVYAKMKKK